MKQILQSYRSGELWLADVPPPQLEHHGVLVRTTHSLVSAGTERMLVELAKKSLLGKARARPDLVKKVLQKIRSEGLTSALQKTFSKLDTPIPLGYSSAGIVVACGRDVREFTPGDRVACAGAGHANHAEYAFVPRTLCAKIPDGVPDEAACYATVGAIALQGVRQADVRLGERVAVVGLGLLGLLTVQLLRASGAVVLGTDPDPERCALARQLGAETAVPGDLRAAVARATGGHGVDAVVLTAATRSNAPIESAAELARVRGRVVVVGAVGMDIPRDAYYRKELELRLSMSYGPGRYDPSYEDKGLEYPYGHVRWSEARNLQCFLETVAQGAVTPLALTTHRFPIDDGLRAYELLQSGDEPFLGITLDYGVAPASPGLEKVQTRVDLGLRTGTPAEGSLGIGLIGAGNYARGVLLPALQRLDGIHLSMVASASGRSAVETAKKHGFRSATAEPDTVFADPDTDAVLIATRHDSHADLTVAALRAGKHVFCEKPLALDEAGLDAVEETLLELGAGAPRLTVGFNRRFAQDVVDLQAALPGPEVPRTILYRINAGAIPADHWIQDPRVGGGRIVGEVCHFIDLCRFLAGAPLQGITAVRRGVTGDGSVADDDLAITLTYANGSLATILYTASGSHELAKEWLELHAGGSSFTIEDFRRLRCHPRRERPRRHRQDKGAAELLREFVTSIRDGGPAPIPVEELLETSRACLAVVDQLRGADRVVKLPTREPAEPRSPRTAPPPVPLPA